MSIRLLIPLHCTISMIDLGLFFIEKSLSEVFGCIILHKKGSRNIIFLSYIRKFSWLRGQFCNTALIQSNIWHKKCLLLTQYYKIKLLIGKLFKEQKKYISGYFFYAILWDQKLLISCMSILNMSTVQCICFCSLKLWSMIWISVKI